MPISGLGGKVVRCINIHVVVSRLHTSKPLQRAQKTLAKACGGLEKSCPKVTFVPKDSSGDASSHARRTCSTSAASVGSQCPETLQRVTRLATSWYSGMHVWYVWWRLRLTCLVMGRTPHVTCQGVQTSVDVLVLCDRIVQILVLIALHHPGQHAGVVIVTSRTMLVHIRHHSDQWRHGNLRIRSLGQVVCWGAQVSCRVVWGEGRVAALDDGDARLHHLPPERRVHTGGALELGAGRGPWVVDIRAASAFDVTGRVARAWQTLRTALLVHSVHLCGAVTALAAHPGLVLCVCRRRHVPRHALAMGKRRGSSQQRRVGNKAVLQPGLDHHKRSHSSKHRGTLYYGDSLTI
jgi:hypothetical protein